MELQELESRTVLALIGGMLLGGSVVYLVTGDFSSNISGSQEVSIQELELNPEKYENEKVTVSGKTEDTGWSNNIFQIVDRLGYSVDVKCDQVPSDSFKEGLEVTVTGEFVNRSKNLESETAEDTDEEDSEDPGYYYETNTGLSEELGYAIKCTEPVR